MHDQPQGQIPSSVARRGVLAGVAAVIAGALARWTVQPADAAQVPLIYENAPGGAPANQAGATVLITARGDFNTAAGASLLEVDGNAQVDGVKGIAAPSRSGVIGLSGLAQPAGYWAGALGAAAAGTTGVMGLSEQVGPLPPRATVGVWGTSANSIGTAGTSGSSFGLYGSSTTNAGVLGQSNSGVGVQGSSNANVGVLGQSNASVGVYASSSSQYGLYATSTSSFAAIGTSNTGTGVYGSSNGNVGVQGSSNSSIGGYFSSGTATGLYATGPAAGFAARFDGPVLVNGNFTAIGGSKSAAVPHPDGTYRRLYAVEAPESWFEDFGEDRIVNGRGRVQLDDDFDALVRGDHYQVFLTPYGDTKGLYVSDRRAHSFEVREVQGGSGSFTFGYRVVAKRRDIPGPRLEKVDIPAAAIRPAAPAPPPLPRPAPALGRSTDTLSEPPA